MENTTKSPTKSLALCSACSSVITLASGLPDSAGPASYDARLLKIRVFKMRVVHVEGDICQLLAPIPSTLRNFGFQGATPGGSPA